MSDRVASRAFFIIYFTGFMSGGVVVGCIGWALMYR